MSIYNLPTGVSLIDDACFKLRCIFETLITVQLLAVRENRIPFSQSSVLYRGKQVPCSGRPLNDVGRGTWTRRIASRGKFGSIYTTSTYEAAGVG
jgi:hypothetical protein